MRNQINMNCLIRNLSACGALLLPHNMISMVEPGAFRGFRNRLTEVHEDMWIGLPSLYTLSLAYNKIHSLTNRIFRRLKNLHLLTLSGNELTEINGDTWKGLPSLILLTLSNNKISRLPWGAFRRQHNLHDLSLPGNNLTEIRAHAWIGLQSLNTLILAGNRIRKLYHGAFRTLPNVTSINPSDNQVKTLRQDVFPEALFQETDVKSVNRSMLTLALQSNPLKCYRKLCWLKEAERREMIDYVYFGFPKCKNFPKRDWSEINLDC